MKQFFSVAVLLLSCAFSAGLLAADAKDNSTKNDDSAKNEVIATENARTAAFVHQDVATLDKLLRDDLTYIHASGRIDNKKSLIEAIKSGQLHYISWTLKEMHVRVLGDTAVLDGEYAVKVFNRPASSDMLDLNALFLAVYVRSGSHWQLIAWQTTKDVRPPDSH